MIDNETNGDRGKSKKESISKLSLGDKSPIIHQTTNWRLDNAVEATHFIKSTFPDPITPQTVRNALKQTTFIMLLYKDGNSDRNLLKMATI